MNQLSRNYVARCVRKVCGCLVAAAAALILRIGPGGLAQAIEPQDFAVEVSARVQSSPPQIRLEWASGTAATSYSVSRKAISEESWRSLATLPSNATSFTDTRVVLGASYEYEIAQRNADGISAYGYIYAGIELPFPGSRGRVVLVVDNTYASPLAPELERLGRDLVGDGWTVLRHDVSRAASPEEVKGVIRADYNADPANTKSVFLFGHVPVPYSGSINPDMHGTHLGAWPADVFYGDMHGTWTDDSVHATDAEDPRNHNVPGDGKYDQSEIPGSVVLQVGRVDLADLPAFHPLTEADLLRAYLNKNHSYRHGLFQVERRGLVRDNFGEIQGDAPATDAWRSFTAFFGRENVHVVGPGDFFSTLGSQSYLWAYGGGGGEYYQADGVGSTTDFARQNPMCVFLMLHGSYFGDWDSFDNFLRAALASPGYGLAAAWTGLPHWFFHHMALGEAIGLSTLIAQNNRGLYKNHVNLSAAQVHIALMGDPTLRMHVVAPPGNLSAVASENGSVTLNWDRSPDLVQGYYVYRADTPSGPFSRLTRSFLSGASFTDVSPPSGPNSYMVRAVKLETSASGTYYNPSQGIVARTDAGGGPVLPVVNIQVSSPTADEQGPVEGAFSITRNGSTAEPLQVGLTIAGSAENGKDYELISESILIPAGSTAVSVSVRPIRDDASEGDETVTLALLSSGAYALGSLSSGTVLIHDRPANHKIQNIVRETNNAIRLEFEGPPGQAFTVEASKDLLLWSTIGTGVSGPNPTTQFTDSQPLNDACRFYRVQWE